MYIKQIKPLNKKVYAVETERNYKKIFINLFYVLFLVFIIWLGLAQTERLQAYDDCNVHKVSIDWSYTGCELGGSEKYK